MHLTPEILKASYDYLKTTPPFKRWGLPDGDEISWVVTGKKKVEGLCTQYANGRFIIEISGTLIKATDTLMATMAHEIIHIRCFMLGVKAKHGYEFNKLAKSVCNQHGWRFELF